MEVWVEKDPTNQKYSMFQQLTGCIEETQLKLGMKQKSDQQVVESLKAEVERHRNGAEPNDDFMIMCIRAVDDIDK